MKIFGRDPVLWLGLLRAIIYAVSVYIVPIDKGVTVAVMAFVAAGVGVWEAWAVARDRLVPVIIGFFESGIVLVLAFGVDLNEEQVNGAMLLVTAALALYTRTQVTAAVDADGNAVAKTPLRRKKPKPKPAPKPKTEAKATSGKR